MRELVIDTETTGLDPNDGHRIVEVAVIELINHLPTGRFFHRYCNPDRDMPEGAFAVHGLSRDFLAKHPVFAAHANEMLEFLGADQLVIHNAEFDLAFLNMELKRVGLRPLALPVVDTLSMARQRFDLGAREKHGARIDGELLAAVYLELVGGRQPVFDLAQSVAAKAVAAVKRILRPARPHAPSEEELAAHAGFMAKLKAPLWTS
jgi:DNA polymerase-3 subunit epsilon